MQRLIKTALFFGSYNPIHIGHMAIAGYILENSDVDEIWFVVTPLNPFKNKESLLAEYHRIELVERAIGDNIKMKASDIEFHLKKPSYTIDTLTYVKEKYQNREFSIIMGEDNINTIHKWKNYDLIIENHKIYVFPRFNEEEKKQSLFHENIIYLNAPRIEMSSSFIRKSISENKDVRYFMPLKAWQYLDEMNFYKIKK